MTKIDDIGYLVSDARTVLPNRRVWCLLKLHYNDPVTGSEHAIAQWDPALQGGSWVLANGTYNTVVLDRDGKRDIQWFIPLGD